MKVAVVSAPEKQSGKSSFMVLLGNLFAQTQSRAAALVSTEEMSGLLNAVQQKSEKSILSSVSVFEAVLSAGSISLEEVFDYGIRIGEHSCYAFDIFDSNYDREQLNSMLLKTIDAVKTDLTLVEVQGDAYSAFNRSVLEAVDVVLYLFTASNQSISMLHEYQSRYGGSEVLVKTGYVCSMYNPNTISEKKLAKMVGVTVRNLMLFPYNTVVQREALLGKLDTVARFIAAGHHEVVNLRPKLLEIMQYLFDTQRVKYILGVDKWYKY